MVAYSLATAAPLANLTPTWHHFKNAGDASARTPQPDIRDDGNGSYSYAPGLSAGEAFAGLVDFGDTANPRYLAQGARYEDFATRTLSVSGVGGTWTFANDPTNTPRDAIRTLLGDTDEDDPAPLTDEEIAFFLEENGDNIYRTAAACAAKLAAYYARQVDYSSSKLSVKASQRSALYAETEHRLLRQAEEGSRGFVSVVAPGLSRTSKAARRADTDAVQPVFEIGMDDMPGNTDRAD